MPSVQHFTLCQILLYCTRFSTLQPRDDDRWRSSVTSRVKYLELSIAGKTLQPRDDNRWRSSVTSRVKYLELSIAGKTLQPRDDDRWRSSVTSRVKYGGEGSSSLPRSGQQMYEFWHSRKKSSQTFRRKVDFVTFPSRSPHSTVIVPLATLIVCLYVAFFFLARLSQQCATNEMTNKIYTGVY